jgi:hypothetical protein
VLLLDSRFLQGICQTAPQQPTMHPSNPPKAERATYLTCAVLSKADGGAMLAYTTTNYSRLSKLRPLSVNQSKGGL